MANEPVNLIDLIPADLLSSIRPLTLAERRLLASASKVNFLDCTDFGDDDKRIRAELLRWLCTESGAGKRIHNTGIYIKNAHLEGKLNFIGATIPCPLGLINCNIKDGIVLNYAKTRAINLQGSQTGPILANNIELNGDLFLRAGFTAHGEVNFTGAKIGGFLDCSGGKFINERGKAILADWIETRSIFLNEGFEAQGEVRFINAQIGGDLACRGGKFINKSGIAIFADGVKTRGNMFLDFGFEAHGEVRLINAKTSGDIECAGGEFINARGVALNAERAEVTGGLLLKSLKNRPIGKINLSHASVGVLLDNEESWPTQGNLIIDGFTYNAFGPDNTPKSAEKRLEWLERQLPPEPPAQPKKPLTEPIRNKYILYWAWLRITRLVCQLLPNINHFIKPPKPYNKRRRDLNPSHFKPQPYEQLAKVLKNAGHESDAREVLVAKYTALRDYGDISTLRRCLLRFTGFTMGYGYKPFMPVLTSLVISVLVGTIAFWLGADDMVQSKRNVFANNMDDYPVLYPFIYSLDVFIPFLDLHQEDYWIPGHNLLLHIYFWFHIAIGWLFTLLSGVALSGVVRKFD